jgi:fatty-acyl-CoA synthase
MTAAAFPSSPLARTQPLLIKRLLEAGLRRVQEQEIVYADKCRMSYPEFGERVGRLAAGLASLGVKAGDTVAVMDWDTHRYLECFFAVPMMGAVLHTINVRLSPEQILYTINHARDDVILVNAEFAPVLEQIWSRVDAGKRLVLLEDGAMSTTSLEFVADYEGLLSTADADAEFDFPEFDENLRATTFYTTGTTGLPKGVYFSHRQLVLHTLAVRDALAGDGQGRFGERDVYMPITPMFHVHAWGLPYLATMLGAKQVYPGRYASDKLVDLLQRERVTFSHCVPTILQMVLNSAGDRGVDLSLWKVIVGGAALTRALATQAVDHGVDLFGGYGMSETGPVLALAQLQPHMWDWDVGRQIEVRCKAGRAISMVDLRIVDDDMNDVPHDGKSSGELVVRAPWLTQGYLHDPLNSENLWRGGWLHTGDIAVIDESGYVKITDRLKDVIKTGGEWISSLDLEDLILRHPCVDEVAVVGMPDLKWTERPVALVVLKADRSVDEAAIKAHLLQFAEQGLISRYGVPERVVFVATLPRTSVGKLDKKSMRAQLADRQGGLQ